MIFIALLMIVSSIAQLSGRVGPTTPISKKTSICNVKDYGDASDVGVSIQTAFDKCVKPNPSSILYIPPGNHDMKTWVNLKGAKNWAFQIDGIIFRQGTERGHMFVITDCQDFEIFSSTKTGAVQGYGFKYHANNTYGARIMRIVKSSDFSMHDLKLVDSPSFHLIIVECKNSELYNLVIRGGNRGALDGINISGDNNHVHHVEVTNRDECVTVKNPSSNFLIESIYCNWSGGTEVGSIGKDTKISNILYQNVYSQNCVTMFTIKSYSGDGLLENLTLRNFIGHNNAYGFDMDQYWYRKRTEVSSGPLLKNVVIDGFHGTITDPIKRPVFKTSCIGPVPCSVAVTNFTLTGVNSPKVAYYCENSIGTGIEGCLTTSGNNAPVTKTDTSEGIKLPVLDDDLKEGLGLTKEIEIPDFPKFYFPPGYEVQVTAGKIPAHEMTAKETQISSNQTIAATATVLTQSESQTSTRAIFVASFKVLFPGFFLVLLALFV